MAIRIHNTQTGKKQEFVPITPGEVKMYVCGPTVYGYLHIGNFRGAIFFNLVRNWLEKRGYDVKYLYNFTDVDDKIINRAKEEGVSHEEISEKYIGEFKKDFDALGLRAHTQNPRVTEYMDDIIEFVKGLVDSDKAYVVEGDVYYNVPNFDEYGKLSHKNIDDMDSGYRIDVDERKKHPADFALWKGAKDGEPAWESPWGAGRPGWHIECSAMIRAILGDTIDIHGGGLDLVFPHHENEVAQSEGLTGKPFVNYWMHNNMLEFGKQKMSKSLGNVRTGHSFLEEYNGEILKYMMLASHYRSTIDFSEEQIQRAIQSLAKFYSALALAEDIIANDLQLVPVPEQFQSVVDESSKGIEESLDDDFNTAEVMARMFEVLRSFNNLARKPGKIKPEVKAVAEVFFAWVREQGKVMSLFQEDPKQYLRILDDMLLKQKDLNRSDIDKLVADRAKARESKDWAEADRLRAELETRGIAVQDTATGSIWEVGK